MMSLYAVTISGLAGSQVVQQKIHVNTPGAPTTVADATAVATAVEYAWRTNMRAVLSNVYTFSYVDVVGVFDNTVGARVAGALTGQVAGDALPSYVTARVRWNTGRRGWAGRGRIGLGPLGEGQTVGNQITTASAGAIRDALLAFIAYLNGYATPISLVVASFVVDGGPRPGGVIYAPVTSFTVSTLVGSQLSRKE